MTTKDIPICSCTIKALPFISPAAHLLCLVPLLHWQTLFDVIMELKVVFCLQPSACANAVWLMRQSLMTPCAVCPQDALLCLQSLLTAGEELFFFPGVLTWAGNPMAVQVSAQKGFPSPPLPETCWKENLLFGLSILLSICFQSLFLRELSCWLGEVLFSQGCHMVAWPMHMLGMFGTDVEKMGQQQDWCMATVLGGKIMFSSLPPCFMGRNDSARHHRKLLDKRGLKMMDYRMHLTSDSACQCSSLELWPFLFSSGVF